MGEAERSQVRGSVKDEDYKRVNPLPEARTLRLFRRDISLGFVRALRSELVDLVRAGIQS